MPANFVLAVVTDLFFVVKIGDAAKRAGLTVQFVSDAARALEKAKEQPAVVFIDLNNDRAEPLTLIAGLKRSDETKAIPLIAYVSHVQVELKRKAEEAGCDRVLARSAVSQNLNEILAGVAAS